MMQRQKELLIVCFVMLLSFGNVLSQSVNLSLPENNDACVPLEATFTWNAQNAIQFHLVISPDANLNNPIVNETNLTDTTFTTTLTDYDVQYYWRVSATFTGGGTAVSSVRTFWTKPAPPLLTSPEDDLVCVPLSVEFNWTSVTGTVDYHLQVSTSENFTTTVYNNNAISNTTQIVNLTQYYNTYYWRVRAIGVGCTTEWSQAREFKTVPQPPNLVYPPNNSLGIGLEDVLEWNVVGGADSYNIQVADNAQFTNPVVNVQSLTSTTYSLSLTDYNKVFYWRTASNFTDCTSPWSQVRNFRTTLPAVQLDAPADSANCVSLNPEFVWQQLSGATSYRLQVSESPLFDTLIIVDQHPIYETSFIGTINRDLTQLFWRVRAEDTSNVGIWSAPRMFNSAIFSPDLISPVNNSTGNPITVILEWDEHYSGAVYSLKVSANPDLSNPLVDINNYGGNTYEITLPEYNRIYYWQVKATYIGCQSAWSPVHQFKTLIGRPELVSPADGSDWQPLNPLYEWKSVFDALTYELQVARDTGFTQILFGQKGIINTQILLGELPVFTTVYWRARASNLEATGDWSDVWSFTTGGQGPDIPELVAPTNELVRVPVETELIWNTAARAETYKVQVSTDEFFTKDIAFQAEEVSDTSIIATNLEHFTNYYWRVASVNESGQSRWSNVRRFRTIAQIPTEASILKSPANNTENMDVRFTAFWFRTQFAQGYHIQVSKNNSFPEAELLIDSKPFDTTYRIDALEYNTEYFWRVAGYNEAGQGPWSLPWSFKTQPGTSVTYSDKSPFSALISPNPFESTANLSFTVNEPGNIRINIYSSLGEKINTVFDGNLESGNHTIPIISTKLAGGLYYCIIESEGNRDIRVFMALK